MTLAVLNGLPDSSALPSSLPAPPTRDAVCRVLCSMQGLMVTTKQLGTQRWWDLMMQELTDPSDRLSAYQQKRADVRPGAPKGDTHVMFSVDMTGLACVPGLVALSQEAIGAGGMTGVLLMCKGDGQNTNVPPGGHDPNALGWEWLMQNFPAIVQPFQSTPVLASDGKIYPLSSWVVFCPGFDGCIPAWQPFTRVNEFARMARQALGSQGHLAIEPSGGYWCWSGEQNDWATSDGRCFDVILQEMKIGTAPPTVPQAYLLDSAGGWSAATLDQNLNDPWDSVWQIIGHMVQPFNRPKEMPTNDYPNGIPYALGGGTPRGPFIYNVWEHSTYEWSPGNSRGEPMITRAQIDARRQCYLDQGCEVVC